MNRSTEHVEEKEPLARFIFSGNYFAKGIVKHGAFLPHPYNELSVSRTASLSKNEIIELGKPVAVKNERTFYGWAEVMVEHIRRCSLEVRPDEPPPRHALIFNWPDEKSAQKLLAMEIAAEAKLFLLGSSQSQSFPQK